MQEIIIHNWDELQRAVFDDVWDEKIFDPLPLAAEHTAQIRDRVAVSHRLTAFAGMTYRWKRRSFVVFGNTGMRNWRSIPVSGNFFRLLSIMDCRRVCLTGPIRRSLLRILPRRTQAVMTATA